MVVVVMMVVVMMVVMVVMVLVVYSAAADRYWPIRNWVRSTENTSLNQPGSEQWNACPGLMRTPASKKRSNKTSSSPKVAEDMSWKRSENRDPWLRINREQGPEMQQERDTLLKLITTPKVPVHKIPNPFRILHCESILSNLRINDWARRML